MRRMLVVALLLAVGSTVGCGAKKKKGTASIALKSADHGAALVDDGFADRGDDLTDERAPGGAFGLAAADDTFVSFTPTSVIMPIFNIGLSQSSTGGGTGSNLYTCSGSADTCGVDLADPAALAKISGSASIDAASYGYSSLDICNGAATVTYKVKGSLKAANGSTYYTSATDVLTTNAAQLDYTKVTINCYSQGFSFPSSVTVPSKGSVTAKLYVSVNNIAFGGPGSTSGGNIANDGCAHSADASVSVCLGALVPVPYAGSAAGTLETYRITVSDGNGAGGGFINLIYDSSGSYFGGFFHKYYDGVVRGMYNFDGPIASYAANADGTATIKSFPPGAPNVTFTAFQRANHSGTFTNAGQTFHYTATKQ